MSIEIDTSESAPWKQRFRAWTVASAAVASNEPSRGIAVTNASGVHQVYAWDVTSGNLNQLTFVPSGKIAASLNPDGTYIYYLDDQQGNEIGHLVRVPYGGGGSEDVTPDMDAYALAAVAFSRDGGHLAFTTATREGHQTYLVELGQDGALGEARPLFHTDRLMRGLYLSNDGSVAVFGLTERSKSTDINLVAVDSATGDRVNELYDEGASVTATRFSRIARDVRILGATTASGVRRPVIWDTRSGERTDLAFDGVDGEMVPVDWSDDGERLLLMQISNAVQRLATYDLTSERLTWLNHPSGMIASVHFGENGQVYAHMNDSTAPSRVVVLDEASGTERRVLLKGGDSPGGTQCRSITYPSTERVEIQAWLATPPGAGPFPTIINIHGGPTAATFNQFSPVVEAWLDHGFATLGINYRGSTTFGHAFEMCIRGKLGQWEVDDLAAAYDWLIQNKIAVSDQVFLLGGSYGGYLTLLGLGMRPELWAGGMAMVAIADWKLMYEDQAETLRQYQVALFGGTPDELPEQHERSSPITYVEQVRVPLQVIQGANDTRCPARQLKAYEERMREFGKDMELHWFDAGHGSYAIEQALQHQQWRMEFARRVLASGG